MNNTIVKIFYKLHDYFGDDESEKVSTWLKTKNPLLGDVSPIYMINIGREKKLLKFIINQIEENGGLNGKSTKNS